jgi:CRP/FNR family transcriptional regulator, cyclic AMP receptor protein
VKQTSFDSKPVVAGFSFPTIIIERYRNENLYSQGEPADAVLYLENGHVKLITVSREGKQAVVGILGPGAFLGESCLAGRVQRESSAIALTSCSARKIPKAEMLLALKKQPQFSEFFLSRVLARNIRLEEDLVDQLCNPCEVRLARALLLLADFGPSAQGDLNPKIDQHTLAAIVGTTQPRISFLLHRFKERGWIECVDRLRINRSLMDLVRLPTRKNSPEPHPDYPILNSA